MPQDLFTSGICLEFARETRVCKRKGGSSFHCDYRAKVFPLQSFAPALEISTLEFADRHCFPFLIFLSLYPTLLKRPNSVEGLFL